MKRKIQKNTKKTKIFIAALMLVVLGVVFLMMEDFSIVSTSLVKQYWGGSSQCVAYVQKYYKDAFGIDIQNVGRAQEMYNKAPRYGLYAHRNGGITPPQPGDILVFGHRNKIGHVAIVTGVIKEGVLIAEQNWGTSRITINGGHALPMIVEDGTYTMPNRDSYYVIGWVSRTLKDPGNIFDFSSHSTEGWIVENDTRKIDSADEDVWTVKIDGKNPTLVSPIFSQGVNVVSGSKVVFRGRIEGNPDPGSGKIFLRDESDDWKYEIPFAIQQNDDFQEIQVDLASVGNSFKVTQMKLMFDDSPVPRKEQWELDWLRISSGDSQSFPID